MVLKNQNYTSNINVSNVGRKALSFDQNNKMTSLKEERYKRTTKPKCMMPKDKEQRA